MNVHIVKRDVCWYQSYVSVLFDFKNNCNGVARDKIWSLEEDSV